MYMLQLIFVFLCFKFISIHNHTQKQWKKYKLTEIKINCNIYIVFSHSDNCDYHFLGRLIWFYHTCQHQSHSSAFSSAINPSSYTSSIPYELDHLRAHDSCPVCGGRGNSESSCSGNSSSSSTAVVTLCSRVPSAVWLFWAWHWVRCWASSGKPRGGFLLAFAIPLAVFKEAPEVLFGLLENAKINVDGYR